MERFATFFPFFATMIVGAANAVAFRQPQPGMTWMVLAVAWGLLAIAAMYLMRREEMVAESFTIVPGDISRGMGGAALAIVLLSGVAFVGIRVMPERAFGELRALIYVATAVPVEWKRALAIVAFAAAEELVFRGTVTLFLEPRFGSSRAPWVASGLYVLTTLPTLKPSMTVAALIIGGVTAFLVSRFRRLPIAIVAHGVFAWLAVEFVLPQVWQALLRPR